MKIFLFLVLLVAKTSFSQNLSPITWETSVEKVSKYTYDIVFIADIEIDWHLYSQHLSEGGPLPTVFKFIPNSNYTIEGQPSEKNAKEVYEEVFEMNVKYFENKAVFKQRLTTKTNESFSVNGEINYMTCDSEKCLPGQFKFQTTIP